MKCMSCNKEFKQGVSFNCPSCSKQVIARCLKCKKLAVNYQCKCGFEGP